jgi:hypothetical protein
MICHTPLTPPEGIATMTPDTIPGRHHYMPPGYDSEDTHTPDFAAINKARDALIELVSRECGDDEGRMGHACGEWIAALEGLPSLEAAHDDDLLD